MLTSPPTLNITNSYFANFIYEFNSFIKVGDFGGFIFVSNSIFENFNTCGAFIRNKRYIYQVSQDDTSAVTNYNTRAINY